MAETLTMPSRRIADECPSDDERLLERFAAGDPTAFDDLVRRHQTRVAGLVYRLLGWRHDVEDTVQEVFMSALKNISTFRRDASLGTWLFRIAVNECHRQQRKRLLRLRLWKSEPAARIAPSAATPTLDRETCAQVRAAVAELPARDREVVVLRHLEDLPIPEIAHILGLSRNAVEVRLTRARQRLRATLSRWLED